MGDRANIHVKEDQQDPGVYLYTHWDGYQLPQTLQNALARRVRWDDTSYLTRIIFDAMTEGHHGREIGFGISTFICDGESRILEVDCTAQTVSFDGHSFSFDAYVALSEPTWALLRGEAPEESEE